MFGASPGSYDICPICFWEDDPVQAADPWYEGGANAVDLATAQRNFAERGVMEPRFAAYVRAPTKHDFVDPAWRPLRESDRAHATTPRAIERTREETGTAPSYHYWLRG